MTNWNISAGANAVNVNGEPSGIDNDHGRVRNGGNVADTAKWTATDLTVGDSTYVTVFSGMAGITGVITGATFNGGDQVIKRVTTDIAGVANTTQRSGASNASNRPFSINQKGSVSSFQYKTAVRTNGWSEFSGTFVPAVTVETDGAWDQATDADQGDDLKANNTDNAANPSQAVPGEFAYRNGSPLPVQDDYEAKTLY